MGILEITAMVLGIIAILLMLSGRKEKPTASVVDIPTSILETSGKLVDFLTVLYLLEKKNKIKFTEDNRILYSDGTTDSLEKFLDECLQGHQTNVKMYNETVK